MGVSNTNNRMDYTGNGAVDTYGYNYAIFDDSELLVTVADANGVETTLTLTTDYTVTGAGEGNGGGNVVLVDNDQAWLDADGDLKTDYALTIRRVLPLTQTTDIRNQGPYYPSIHEDQFDRCIMIDQQQQDELDRCIKLPETEDGSGMTLPSLDDRAGNIFGFNDDGEPVAVAAGINTAITTAYTLTLLDDSTAAEARTTLDAQRATESLTALSAAPATDDVIPIYDTSATTNKKLAISNLFTTPTITSPTITTGTLNNPILNGSRQAVLAKATGYTLTSADSLVYCDASGGSFTLTLPDCASNSGRLFTVKLNVAPGANAVTIARAGSDTIDGMTSLKMGTFGDSITICSGGSTVWHIVHYGIFNGVLSESNTARSITSGTATTAEFLMEDEIYDPLGQHSITTAVFTVQVPGKYQVKAMVELAVNAGWARNERVELQLFKNGSLNRTMGGALLAGHRHPNHVVLWKD